MQFRTSLWKHSGGVKDTIPVFMVLKTELLELWGVPGWGVRPQKKKPTDADAVRKMMRYNTTLSHTYHVILTG